MDANETRESPVFDRFDSPTRVVSGFDRDAIERHLWVIVALSFVADVHLTYVGLQHGLTEGNPVIRWVIAHLGIGALIVVKLAVITLAALVRWHRPRHGPVVPLGLAVPSATAVALNAVTLGV